MRASAHGVRTVVRVTLQTGLVARIAAGTALSAVVALTLPAVSASATVVTYSDTPVASWQVNGVGYAALLVGNTVYVGGSFTEARSPDGTSTAPRTNLAAFDATTGELLADFHADTDGRVNALATDGTTLFVGGSFTHVDGVARSRLAAVSPSTGAVQSWSANASSNVYALGVGGGDLYVGGSFSKIKGVARSRLAAVRISDGALTDFTPRADATVNALAVSPDGSAVYAGGSFTTIDGSPSPYLAGFTASGSLMPLTWASVNAPVDSLSLRSDATRLAVGYAGTANQTSYYSTDSGSRLWASRCDGDA